jgi:NADP-dependent 3-hydroxy acid dehydrogenase YdfG
MSATTTSPAGTEPMPGVKGKGVLVTGGTSGIGQAIGSGLRSTAPTSPSTTCARQTRRATPTAG